MKTKSLFVLAIAALLASVAGSACAGSSIYAASTGPESLNHFTPHVLPVLVSVNKQGKVTSVASAYKLRPKYQTLLHKTVDEMISHPAHDKNGHVMSSQFVMYLSAKTEPRADGKYNLQFAYVKAVPVPFGSWYWGHLDGSKLALFSQEARHLNYLRSEPLNQFHVDRVKSMINPDNITINSPSNVAPTQHAVHLRPAGK